MPADPASTPDIAISYRRDDTRAEADRLAHDLARVFGDHRIRVDFAELAPGEAFDKTLERTLSGFGVLLVLIGPHWLSVADDQGRPRIRTRGDVVRAEVATALRLGLHVVPVLVDGTALPSAADLPADLHYLAARRAAALSSRHWHRDLNQLTTMLAALGAKAAPPRAGDNLRGGFRTLLDTQPAPPSVAAAAPASTPAPAPVPVSVSAPRSLPQHAGVPQPPGGRDIFISYAFEDEAWAQRVVQALEPLGYACWVASRDIVPGTASYAREITRAIRTSRLLIVLLSAASNDSDDVLNEVTLAKDHRVPRLPLRLDDAPLGDGMLYFFSQAQRLDGGALSEAAVIDRLTASVQQQLGAPGPAAAG